MIQWIDLAAHGLQLRGAQREGEVRQVVAVPAPIEGELSAEVRAALAGLGFGMSGFPAVLHRAARGLLVTQVLAAFPNGRPATLAAEELFTAPYPDGRNFSPLGRLATALAECRVGALDMLGTATALERELSLRSKSKSAATAWERWAIFDDSETLAGADAQAIALWMESKLRTQTFSPSGDAEGVSDVVPTFAVRVHGEHRALVEAQVSWENTTRRGIDAELSLDELRAQDVEMLLGETPRVELARSSIGVSRRWLGAAAAAIDNAVYAAADTERRAREALWGPFVAPRSDAIAALMKDAAFDVSKLFQQVEVDGRIGWSQPPSGAIYFTALPEGTEWRRGSITPSKSMIEDNRQVDVSCLGVRAPFGALDFPMALFEHKRAFLALNAHFVDLAEALAPGGRWRGPEETTREGRTPAIVYEVDGAVIAIVAALGNTSAVDGLGTEMEFARAQAAAGWPGCVPGARSLTAGDSGEYRAAPEPLLAAGMFLDASSWTEAATSAGRDEVTIAYMGVSGELSQRATGNATAGLPLPWAELDACAAARILQGGQGSQMYFHAELLPERERVGSRMASVDAARALLTAVAAGAVQIQGTRWYLDADADRGAVFEVHAPYSYDRARRFGVRAVADADAARSVIVMRKRVGEDTWTVNDVVEPLGAANLVSTALERGLVRITHPDDPYVIKRFRAQNGQTDALAFDAELGLLSDAFEDDGDGLIEAEVLDPRDPETDDVVDDGPARIEDFGAQIGGARKDLAGLGVRALEVSMTETWSSEELREYLTKDRLWPFSVKAQLAAGCEPAVLALAQAVRKQVRPAYQRFYRSSKRGLLEWDDREAREWAGSVRVIASTFEGITSLEELTRRARAAFDVDNSVARYRQASISKAWYHRSKAFWRVCVGGLASVSLEEKRLALQLIEQLVRALQRTTAAAAMNGDTPANGRTRSASAPRISARPHLAQLERLGPSVREGSVTPEQLATTFGFRAGEFGNWLGQKERQEVLNFAFEAFSDLARVLGVPARGIALGGELAIAFGSRGTGGKRAAAAHYEPGRRVINLTRLNGAGSLAHEFAHAFDHYIARTLAFGRAGTFASNVDGGGDVVRALSQSGLRHELAEAVAGVVGTLHRYTPTEEERLAVSQVEVRRQIVEVRDRWQMFVDTPDNAISEDLRAAALEHPSLEAAIETYSLRYAELAAALHDGIRVLDHLAETFVADPHGVAAAIRPTAADITRALSESKQAGDALWWAGRAACSTVKIERWTNRNNKPRQYDTCEIRSRVYLYITDREVQPRSFTTASQFALDAKAIDAHEKRKKPYWADPIELFARAFESWVYDRMAASGERSDYLVHGVKDAGFVYAERHLPLNSETTKTTDAPSARGLFPYPRGVERAAINAAFDTFASSLKDMVDAEGHCKLYKRRGEPLPAGQGMDVEAVVRAVHRFRGRVNKAFSIEVVADVGELPMPAPLDVAGHFDGLTQTVYLVASNLRGTGEVHATLAHEILRHGGLFVLLGDQREPVLDAIWADNPEVRQRADALRAQGLVDGVLLNRSEATEEALAQLADEGALATLGGWQRAVAWIKGALRDAGLAGIAGRWNDRDVSYLMTRAARASGLRPHAVPTAGSPAPDSWMMRFFESPRRALTLGTFVGSLLGAGMFGAQAPDPPITERSGASWPSVYAPFCLPGDDARRAIAHAWSVDGIPREAFSESARQSLAVESALAAAAADLRVFAVDQLFGEAIARVERDLGLSEDPELRAQAKAAVWHLLRASSEAMAGERAVAQGAVETQILAALERTCQDVADAYAPPVRWADPRESEQTQEETAAAPVRSGAPGM